MVKAGVVNSEKRGRQFIQRADIDTLKGLMLFLAKDCCQGRAELCEPLLAELACCCSSSRTSRTRAPPHRSDERRVGKEWCGTRRSWWSRSNVKNNVVRT